MRKRFGVGGVRGGSSPRCRGASDFKSRTRVYPSTHRLSLLLLLSNPIRVNEILGEISNRDAIPFSAVGAYLDEISALTRNLNFAERRLFAVVGSSNRFIDFVTDRGFYGPEGTENFGSKINIITSLLSGQVWRNGFKERGGGGLPGQLRYLDFPKQLCIVACAPTQHKHTHARTHARQEYDGYILADLAAAQRYVQPFIMPASWNDLFDGITSLNLHVVEGRAAGSQLDCFAKVTQNMDQISHWFDNGLTQTKVRRACVAPIQAEERASGRVGAIAWVE